MLKKETLSGIGPSRPLAWISLRTEDGNDRKQKEGIDLQWLISTDDHRLTVPQADSSSQGLGFFQWNCCYLNGWKSVRSSNTTLENYARKETTYDQWLEKSSYLKH